MRVAWQWIFRERAVRGPAALELDVLEITLTREVAGVKQATGEAVDIADRLDAARAELAADLANDGIVDATEARRLARKLIGATIPAHNHIKTLEGLT